MAVQSLDQPQVGPLKKPSAHHHKWLCQWSANQFSSKFSESVEKSLGRRLLRSEQPPQCIQFINKKCVVWMGSSAPIWLKFWVNAWNLISQKFYSSLEAVRPLSKSEVARGRSRPLEAARGWGHFWHPETRRSHLSTIYGGLNDLGIEWPQAASSNLGFI